MISPFIGSGLAPPLPPPGGGNAGGFGFGQGLASAFSNSGAGNNPFGELIQLGQTFAGALNKNPPPAPQKQPISKPKDKPKPQSDAPQVTASPLAMFRPSLIPLEDEPLLKIFKPRRFNNPPARATPPPAPPTHNGLIALSDEPLLKIFKQREGGRASQGPSRANSPFLRLTENFGKNFFHMMDELEEYTGPNARAATKGVSGLTAPGTELSDTPTTNTPQDFLSAHNLMTAFFKAVSRDPRTNLRPLPIINDGTEAGRNRPLMDQLFESDILLTSKQMKA